MGVSKYRFIPKFPAEYPGIPQDSQGYIECKLYRPAGRRGFIEAVDWTGYKRTYPVPFEPLEARL